MLRIEHYEFGNDDMLPEDQVKAISEAFAESEKQLKEDLKEAERLQRLSEWYAMQLPPEGA